MESFKSLLNASHGEVLTDFTTSPSRNESYADDKYSLKSIPRSFAIIQELMKNPNTKGINWTIDDSATDLKKNKDLMTKIIYNSRHLFNKPFNMMIASQTSKDIPPSWRHNADTVLASKPVTGEERNKLRKDYLDIATDGQMRGVQDILWQSPYQMLMTQREDGGGTSYYKYKATKDGKDVDINPIDLSTILGV
jgi:hypothetical protein